MKNNKLISLSAVLLLTLSTTGCNSEKLQEYLVKIAFTNADLPDMEKRMNRRLPRKLDEETVLLKINLSQEMIEYQHELTNYAADEIDIAGFQELMQPDLKQRYCTHSALSALRSMDMSGKFTYLGKHGKEITAITINPAACKGVV